MMKQESQIPIRKNEIVVRTLDNEGLLYHPHKKELHVLNKTSLAIWELCDGSHNLEDIEQLLSERFKAVERDVIKRDVEQTISKFSQSGLIDLKT